jgi:undecaprenyl diphosphate synthase
VKNVPRHIGIILDGNRRWAKQHALSVALGHTRGVDGTERIVKHCLERSIEYLTVYGFSIENWQRTDEVPHLMRIFEDYARDKKDEFIKKGIRVRLMGQLDRLPSSLQAALNDLIAVTQDCHQLIFTLCLSYGGRDEIVRAVQALMSEGTTADKITEKMISDRLDSHDIPDPDLIIRTSGEQRLSNFLTWQSSYSELYFTPTLWPDFDEAELDKAITWYQQRDRRKGK